MSEDFVRIEGISKTFGVASPALDQITAAIKGGEITGLVGSEFRDSEGRWVGVS